VGGWHCGCCLPSVRLVEAKGAAGYIRRAAWHTRPLRLPPSQPSTQTPAASAHLGQRKGHPQLLELGVDQVKVGPRGLQREVAGDGARRLQQGGGHGVVISNVALRVLEVLWRVLQGQGRQQGAGGRGQAAGGSRWWGGGVGGCRDSWRQLPREERSGCGDGQTATAAAAAAPARRSMAPAHGASCIHLRSTTAARACGGACRGCRCTERWRARHTG
jgi:hypothetical protein